MSRSIALDAGQEAIVRAVLARHLPGDAAAYVFGSRATGCARPMSDLDLALQASAAIPETVMIDLAEAFDESDLPWKVDLIDWAVTSERFRALIAPDLRLLVAPDRVEHDAAYCGDAR